LERLPGIGPSRAKAILTYRGQHGNFQDLRELARVPGIPNRLVSQLAGKLVVP
jgi:competence protein ComEA